MKTKRYNHAYTIAFEVVSRHPEGGDVTAEMMRTAIRWRLGLGDAQLLGAVGAPFDTHEEATGGDENRDVAIDAASVVAPSPDGDAGGES